jgi:hypothetical protein
VLSRSWFGRLVGRREQVGRREAAVRTPLLGDVEDLLLGWAVVEGVGALDGLAQREVAGKNDVRSSQRDEKRALRRPGTDAGYGGQCGDEFFVGQPAQDVGVQPAVRQPLGQIPQGGDLPPGQTGLLIAELQLDDRPQSPLLDAAAEVIAEAGPKLARIVSAMNRGLSSRRGNGAWDAVVEALVEVGVLAPSTGGLRPGNPLTDDVARDEIVARLRAAATADDRWTSAPPRCCQ